MRSTDPVREAMLSLANHLDGLSEAQWDTASLCEEWRVRDVLAHTTAGAEGAFGASAIIGGLLRHGFDYNRWVAIDGRTRGEQDPTAVLAAFRTAAERPRKARASEQIRALAHVLIHGQDICRPLGIERALPESDLAIVADFTATSFIFRARRRISDVRLTATDIKWSLGDGPEVSGPAEALVMMMAGRPNALDDLSGPGIGALRRAR
ncbi:MAG TPA: maleylpyruvate isomerase family mycothiol-dependent enzyme [Mycobacteriales bacterium]|nr:maleylpyruvate isomerase family mycothiol-dependent enzyme [Mycobacteriales bacterium]